MDIVRSDLHYPQHLHKCELATSLSKFLIEVCKLNGSEYPPQILYQMIVCMQMYLQTQKLYWHLFDKSDAELSDLYYTLDNIMKERTAQGLGRTISVDIIELQVEQKMWKDGVLGQDQPRQLLDTIIYLLGIHLALHGGYEHRVL